MVKRSKQLESTMGSSIQKMNEMETELTASQLRISQVTPSTSTAAVTVSSVVDHVVCRRDSISNGHAFPSHTCIFALLFSLKQRLSR